MKKLVLCLCILSLFTSGCNLFGKSSEEKLTKQLESTDPKLRRDAAQKLGKVATAEALRILLVHKNDKNFRVKAAIKKAIEKIDGRTFLN